MGEYVEITGGVGDIISAAQSLVSRGQQLGDDVGRIRDTIVRQEGLAETFPPDDFTNAFRVEYDKDVPVAPDK